MRLLGLLTCQMMTWQQRLAVAPHQVPGILPDQCVLAGEGLQLLLHGGVVINPHSLRLKI
jgi:hypothetical protein